VTNDRRLGPRSREIVDESWPLAQVAVSGISFWEIGMLIQKGRLQLDADLAAWRRQLLNAGLVELPVDGGIGAGAGLLPELEGDPADRLIVATALAGHRLMTADRRILDWSGPLDSLDARV